MASRTQTAASTLGSGGELNAIAACVIGGASLFGGKGKVIPGAIIGIVMVQVISNGLTIIGASAYIQNIFKGLIIFVAVMVDSIKNNGDIH